MSALQEKTVEIISKLDALATQYSPEVIDTALSAVRMSGLVPIITGIALCGGAIAIVLLGKVYFKGEENLGYIVVSWLIAVLIAIAGLCHLLDIWDWVAMWNPKLAMAYKILCL